MSNRDTENLSCYRDGDDGSRELDFGVLRVVEERGARGC